MSDRLSRRAFLGSAAVAAAAAAAKPNLLFVFSDQQSADMLGCYGNTQIRTPNLDRFAAQGVRFNHCISNSPLCTPYRGLLLSGQHPLQSGALENDVRMLDGGGNYFGEVLRDAGYRMGYVGKWHLYGGDRDRPIPPGTHRYGFDHTFLSNNCTVTFDAERSWYWDEEGNRKLYGDWEPYAQTRQGLRFIDDNADRPFALFVSWHPPHNWIGKTPPKEPADTYGAPADLLKLYDPAGIELRGNCADTPGARRLYQGYMAMGTSVDTAFGWLMHKLEEKGLADNTLVVFTSDHGDTALSHGLLNHKLRPEIESIRVPLMIRYPRLLKPRASELLVGTLDLMPTLLNMLGLKAPATCAGNDLTGAIAKGRDNEVESVPLFLFPVDWRGVYTRRFTYSFDNSAGHRLLYRELYFAEPRGLSWNCLYDRESDPWELKNLYGSPEHARLQRRLHDQARAWMERYGDGGLPYERIASAVYSGEDREHARNQRWSKMSGLLKGRPAELLR